MPGQKKIKVRPQSMFFQVLRSRFPLGCSNNPKEEKQTSSSCERHKCAVVNKTQ